MPPKQNRPAGTGRLTTTTTTALRVQAQSCPWMRAALRLADPAVIAAILLLHPAARCPAARPRPVRFEDIPRAEW